MTDPRSILTRALRVTTGVLARPSSITILRTGLVAVLLAACSDATGPVALPTAPLAGPTHARRNLFSEVSPNGQTLTIVDEDGTTYTLDMVSRELHNSAGEILMLDGQQFAGMLTAFTEVLDSDPAIPALQSLTTPNCNHAEGNPCVEEPLGIGTGVSLTQLAASSRGRASGIGTSQWGTSVLTPTSGFMMKRGQPTSGAFLTPQSNIFRSNDLGSNGFGWDPNSMCRNVLNAAMGKTIDYRGKRTSFARNAITAGTMVVAREVSKKWLPVGSVAAIRLMYDLVEHTEASVAIGFLRGTWNDYQCDANEVVAGPYFRDNSRTLTLGWPSGGFSYHCEREVWSISWDNGNTWMAIHVDVCMTYAL